MLHLPITELDKQPYDWVSNMMDYLQVKGEAEAKKAKETNHAGKKDII